MANGVLCKTCGYQENAHEGAIFQEWQTANPDGTWKEFAKIHPKLAQCKGYVPRTDAGYADDMTPSFMRRR